MRRRRGRGILPLLIAFLLASPVATQAQQQQPKIKVSAIEILKVQSTEVKLPPDFQMALYENLIAEVRKSGRFQNVYRDGERVAADAPDLVVLHSTVQGFKEGSERLRQVTTVAGTTSIKVRVQFVGRDGRTLLERDLAGKVHFFGANLRATYNFAKNVAKVVRDNFQATTEETIPRALTALER